MKKLLAIAVVVPGIACAAGPFDGNWKLRVSSMTFTSKPDVYELANGTFSCSSCVPPYKIKSDGTDQPVAGHEYMDQESVKIIDKRMFETVTKKDGKVLGKATWSVSIDGKTLMVRFTDYSGAKPIDGSFIEKRLSAGAAGTHAVSGSWQAQPLNDLSDTALKLTFQSTANGMKVTWNGQVTDATFDGKEYLVAGDPGKTMVTMNKVGDSEIDETDKRSGKVYDNIVWKVSADGKTLSFADEDPVHGTKTTWVADRQK